MASRVSVACVALMFATMGGARRMDTHAMSGHGTHFGNSITDAAPDVSQHSHGSHAAHHLVSSQDDGPGDPERDQQSNECTCVGPCQNGAAPNVTRPTIHLVTAHEVDSAPQVATTVHLVRRDPTSHLLPLPTAPPSRV
jgi:hypothetical protein